MLLYLHIENYALIKNLDIRFDKGFSVITGETGAGKSIIMGALGLLLGQRADLKTIKEGENKCIIEASFILNEQNKDIRTLFESYDIDYDNNTIIRREILSSGKSRMFVNDTPVNIQFLKEISDYLIDIHSQHENLLLKSNDFQLNLIDTIASHQDIMNTYLGLFNDYQKSKEKLANLRKHAEQEKNNYDYFLFQFDQLNNAKLDADEQESLEQELDLLNNAEEIKLTLNKVVYLLKHEGGIVANLKTTLQHLQSIAKYLNTLENITQRIESSYIDINDLSLDIQKLENNIEYDSNRLGYVTERLDFIHTLLQKHKAKDVKELISIKESFGNQLELIRSFDEEIEQLTATTEKLYNSLIDLANKISANRHQAAQKVKVALKEQLATLSMPYVQFEIQFTSLPTPNALGIDAVELLFSSNKNTSPKPIKEIASGGEIARVMLCIKYLIATHTTLPTIIFDEIDTGVSGEIASKMAKIMQKMSENIQVICITHLPQIAAQGNTHYKVFKVNNESSETQVSQLGAKERQIEIAKMLSGSVVTEAALNNASVLLSGSEKL